jgi:hypothetical protein
VLNLLAQALIAGSFCIQAHGVRRRANFFSGDYTSPILDHVREGLARHQRVDQFAVKSIRKFSQLAERNAFLGFGQLGFVQR